jgi:hypothetical protein
VVFLRPGDQAAEAPTLAEPLHRETPDVLSQETMTRSSRAARAKCRSS